MMIVFSIAVPSQPYKVTGMIQDTAYEVRVAARTAAGTGDYSQMQVERTKKQVSSAPVLNAAHQLLHQTLLTLLIAGLASAYIYI